MGNLPWCFDCLFLLAGYLLLSFGCIFIFIGLLFSITCLLVDCLGVFAYCDEVADWASHTPNNWLLYVPVGLSWLSDQPSLQVVNFSTTLFSTTKTNP